MSDKPFLVRALPVVRWITLACLIFFSLVVLGASGNLVSVEMSNQATAPSFVVFALVTAVLNLLLISPMFIIDFFRRGAFTSMIVVELPVLGFFFLFWLSSAAWTSNQFQPIRNICSRDDQESLVQQVCTDVQLQMAFGWLNWILVLAYFVMLLTIAIMGANKGGSIWKSTVRECDFGYGSPMPSATLKARGLQNDRHTMMMKTEQSSFESIAQV